MDTEATTTKEQDMDTTTTEYHVTITAPSKKFRQATAAMKRYGGEFDRSEKVWIFYDEPHAAVHQWGDVEEVEVDTDPYGGFDDIDHPGSL